ncbi:hypothetical protein CVT24_007828 [Panaeolus cyanescens]|uniref:Hydrophobin n=1 Tax=Panaeolus cyanescens TaxID=181874 RepID=A0A409VZK4_9AGAR|nr:hypothetical protein CVT24_007828 [Panaeolus cyanescens]
MFSRAAAFSVFALPILAAATAIPRDGDCNTGQINCCNSTMTSSLTTLATLSGLLGLSLPAIGGLIGPPCLFWALEETLALPSQSAALTTASEELFPLDAPPSTSTFDWVNVCYHLSGIA